MNRRAIDANHPMMDAHGAPTGINRSTMGMHRQGTDQHRRTTDTDRPTTGIHRRAIDANHSATDIFQHAMDIRRQTMDIHRQTIGINRRTIEVNRVATHANQRTLEPHQLTGDKLFAPLFLHGRGTINRHRLALAPISRSQSWRSPAYPRSHAVCQLKRASRSCRFPLLVPGKPILPAGDENVDGWRAARSALPIVCALSPSVLEFSRIKGRGASPARHPYNL
jgi:hypothetical protein